MNDSPILPEALAPEYSRFRVTDRVPILMTGHSHQAWPDVAREAVLEAFDDAAKYADGKWGVAYDRAARVEGGWRRLLGDDGADAGVITLSSNTHDVLIRFLSALDWSSRPRLITTDAEFHTVRRQTDRLAESGWVSVTKVAGRPVEGVVDRLITELDSSTGCVILSSVYFETSEIVPDLSRLAAACRALEVPLLIDAYHHLGVIPFSLAAPGLDDAFVMGGGYKYVQLGEGNCFLRSPAGCEMRPVVTGWFSEFAELADEKVPGEVRYGIGSARFMGATYDPTSHYRAAAVFRFFEEKNLTPERLRALNQRQLKRLAEGFAGVLGISDPVGSDVFPGLRRGYENVGGFLAVATDRAGALHEYLATHGVLTDFRGSYLRFGPAPYISDAQLDRVVNDFAGAVEAIGI